jgi:hypothetical protein
MICFKDVTFIKETWRKSAGSSGLTRHPPLVAGPPVTGWPVQKADTWCMDGLLRALSEFGLPGASLGALFWLAYQLIRRGYGFEGSFKFGPKR